VTAFRALGLAIGTLLFAETLSDAQVFRARAEAVRVDVLVANGNRPIAGLTPADFEVLDNGVAQAIDAVTIEDVPFSVLLALDASESMEGGPLKDLKTAAAAAVESLRDVDRAAVLTFSEELRQPAAWLPKGPALARAIDGLRASGATALFDAAFAALILRDADPGRRALVLVFSDGEDTSSWLPASAALDKASRTDAVVYSVSIRSVRQRGADLDATVRSPLAAPSRSSVPVSQRSIGFRSGIRLSPNAPLLEQSPFLPELAQRTGGEALNVDTTGKLRDAFERIVREFRSRYLLTYTPRGVDTPGWHRIEVKVKGQRATVQARKGYER
jgi:Ca-activated chloride channel homolog